MPDDATLRGRRSYRHRKNDHSLCKPERCAALGAKVTELRPVPPTPKSLVDTYRDSLEIAGRLETPEGELVLVLAEQLVRPQGQTASALATLSKELRAAYEAAVKGAPRSADGVDELQARRRVRILGA